MISLPLPPPHRPPSVGGKARQVYCPPGPLPPTFAGDTKSSLSLSYCLATDNRLSSLFFQAPTSNRLVRQRESSFSTPRRLKGTDERGNKDVKIGHLVIFNVSLTVRRPFWLADPGRLNCWKEARFCIHQRVNENSETHNYLQNPQLVCSPFCAWIIWQWRRWL